jgi:hypothetical protein
VHSLFNNFFFKNSLERKKKIVFANTLIVFIIYTLMRGARDFYVKFITKFMFSVKRQSVFLENKRQVR